VIEQKQLDVGDAVISVGDVTMIFERKAGADLAASVKDGRYREQKRRMGDATVSKHVTYIVENANNCSLQRSIIDGVVVNTMYRDGMHVIFTDNVRHTADWLITIAYKVLADPAKFAASDSTRTYIDSLKVKSKKIENIDKKTCYLLQLAQIPGVSTKLAESIAEVYPSMYQLLHDLRESGEARKMLCKIPLIGDKKAKTILEYLDVPT
jgi:crossover junction endonuclease MUS81